MKVLAFFFIVLALVMNTWATTSLTDSAATDVQLRTYLERDNVPLNKEVVYHVELSWQGDLQRYHILKAGEPVLTNLKLRGSGSANNFFLDEQGKAHSKKTITYYFVPQTMGMAYVDGVIIKYEDKQTGLKGSLISQRLGVKIIEAAPEPGKGVDLGGIIVILIVVLFILIVAYFVNRYYMIKRRRKAMLAQKPQTLEEVYLSRLQKEIRDSGEDTSHKFIELSRLLQNYFKEKFDLRGAAGFNEIENELPRHIISDDIIKKLKTFLEQSELNKFAGEKISEHDFHLFYDTVELLLGKMNTDNDEDKQMLEEK